MAAVVIKSAKLPRGGAGQAEADGCRLYDRRAGGDRLEGPVCLVFQLKRSNRVVPELLTPSSLRQPFLSLSAFSFASGR
jgi:hypothetical protein